MKRVLAAITIASVPMAAVAVDEAAMERLKETKICLSCDLSGADMRWANVYAAELGGAPNLVNGDLSGSDLSGANLFGANLEGAKLRDTDLTGANLSFASLLGADFTGATMDDANTQGAKFCNTIMPDGSENDANC